MLLKDSNQNIVVKSLVSPQSTYTAEVVDSDQGALGGAAYVDVQQNNKSINLLLCEFSKAPVRVYSGEWEQLENMQISWKDDNTLVIDGKEYYISD